MGSAISLSIAFFLRAALFQRWSVALPAGRGRLVGVSHKKVMDDSTIVDGLRVMKFVAHDSEGDCRVSVAWQ